MLTDAQKIVHARCESPIEQLFCTAAFLVLGCEPSLPITPAELRKIAAERAAPFAILFVQHPIAQYRVDCLIAAVDPDKRKARRLVIECDGHAFHSTLEQIAADQMREVEIKRLGYLDMMRFTGSELRSNMLGVMREVHGWLVQSGIRTWRPHTQLGISLLTDRTVIERRRKEREEAYRREERETFVGDDGVVHRWGDTL